VHGLAYYFDLDLPLWLPEIRRLDNWQTSAWGRATGHIRDAQPAHDDHL